MSEIIIDLFLNFKIPFLTKSKRIADILFPLFRLKISCWFLQKKIKCNQETFLWNPACYSRLKVFWLWIHKTSLKLINLFSLLRLFFNRVWLVFYRVLSLRNKKRSLMKMVWACELSLNSPREDDIKEKTMWKGPDIWVDEYIIAMNSITSISPAWHMIAARKISETSLLYHSKILREQ